MDWREPAVIEVMEVQTATKELQEKKDPSEGVDQSAYTSRGSVMVVLGEGVGIAGPGIATAKVCLEDPVSSFAGAESETRQEMRNPVLRRKVGGEQTGGAPPQQDLIWRLIRSHREARQESDMIGLF